MKSLYIGGAKGGTGKTTTAHMLCLGAHLRNEAAVYVLTDPLRKVRAEGRPYVVLDGRIPENLAGILANARSSPEGWLIIDGGGNRPEFDRHVNDAVDVCLLPFRASEEDLDTVAQDLARLPHAIAWPTAWPTNAFATRSARYFIDALEKAYPGRVLDIPIPFVNSISELLAHSLGSPGSPIRQTARRAFDAMSEHLVALEAGTTSQPRDGRATQPYDIAALHAARAQTPAKKAV
jgi:cellulose biosynthesis protein BcsQ